MKKILPFVVLTLPLFTAPMSSIPEELFSGFTMGGQIPVVYDFRNDAYGSDKPLVYTKDHIDSLIDKVNRREVHYYGATDTYLFEALDQFRPFIAGKKVAVLGSTVPWYESVLIAYGSEPTTIEYNKIVSEDPRLKVLTVAEYQEKPEKFDAVLSISSFEHDGLGRYGDPINPSGDLEAMASVKKMLNDDGLLFLAVPVGQDCLVWNLHRIYGRLRLKALLTGWRIVQYFGFTYEDLDRSGHQIHQPIFVLKPMPEKQ